MGQGGNAWEWEETEWDGTNDNPGSGRWIRGGACFDADDLASWHRIYSPVPSYKHYAVGFRVASVMTFTITTGPTTNGLVTGNTSPYFADATATLTATSNPGYIFSGWTGDATGTVNPLTVLMDSNKTIGATFVQDTRDTDGDGLNNYQELVVYGTNPSVKDTDGDGFEDGYEVNSGYSPTSATSSPDTQLVIYTAVEVRFGAGLGKTYRVESSTDLKTWTPVEEHIAGTGGTIAKFYSIREIPKRYFRSVRE